ncbi:MAG: zinc ribbon domain-containing protein [Gammaproteobacteria bacterium]|nr:zinc ribbon domain-containing protein [Gammaproteobacteria bacterium]
MPTYDYRCPDGHTFELFQRMSDEPVAECPTCGARAGRILSAGAGFLFKGEGFYITDYRSESYRKAAEAEKSAQSGKSGSKKERAPGGAKGPSGDGPGKGATPPADAGAGSSGKSAGSANRAD